MEKYVGEDSPGEDQLRLHSVGEQLQTERERLKLSLADMAAKTRVPMRHLESIEKSDFASLPGTTYTLGFARSYARALDMDAAKVSSELRAEMAQGGHEGYQAPAQNYEPADPSRVPSRTLAWTAAIIGILVVAGYLFWRTNMIEAVPAAPPVAQSAAPAGKAAKSAASPAAAAPAGGDVVLTANDTVWVKIYDADEKRLYEKEMQRGESFTVPGDANKPMIVTGRPQALDVTVGGKAVPVLGPADETVADLEISAAALLARGTATGAAPAAAAAGN